MNDWDDLVSRILETEADCVSTRSSFCAKPHDQLPIAA
jgi:hypothetical protein